MKFISCFLLVLSLVSFSYTALCSDFLSIKYNKVKMRVGPGSEYPIKWIYTQKNMPLRLLDNFDNWRKVSDIDNEEGWIHIGSLSKTQFAITKQKTNGYCNSQKDDICFTLDPMVILKLIRCKEEICKLSINNKTKKKIWVNKQDLWGIDRS